MAEVEFLDDKGSVIGEKSWTTARVIDELSYVFRTKDLDTDPETGHERSRYEKQGEYILYRMNIYKPAPSFVLYTSDLDVQLERELSNLDDESLDDVMKEAIYRLLDELNVSDFKIDVLRRGIRWEIQE
jgi:hypothetical protein